MLVCWESVDALEKKKKKKTEGSGQWRLEKCGGKSSHGGGNTWDLKKKKKT